MSRTAGPPDPATPADGTGEVGGFVKPPGPPGHADLTERVKRTGSSDVDGALWDVCIVGSGASGALVADRLSRAGLRVLVVEQGDWVAPGTFLWDVVGDYETCLARDDAGAWTDQGLPWTACAVGGGTRFFAGMSFRLREVDFAAAAHVAADALDPTWPVDYAILRPYYDAVERLVGVSRSANGDPTAPPAAPPVLPPLPMSRRGDLIAAAARQAGLSPFPTPAAVSSQPFAGAPACQELTACTDWSCPVGAKGDVATRILAPLVHAGRVRIRTRCKAVALVESSPGVVSQLTCLDLVNRREVTFRARHFVLAANAVQTAALLLRSISRYSPRGLGNAHDMVGRGLCFKVGQYLYGVATDVPPEPSARDAENALRGRYSTVSLADHYVDADCPSGLGGLIHEANFSVPGQEPEHDGVLLRLECLLGDQPMHRNRVALTKDRDRHGLPVLAMDYLTHPLDRARLAYLRAAAGGVLRLAGAAEVTAEPVDYSLGSAHLHGTCRSGTDPRTSVTDGWGRPHDVDNLTVVDGSLMPWPGGVNPTLTIQANALRVSEHLATDLTGRT